MIQTFAFYLFAVLLLAAGALVILSRNPVHAVLWLIVAFFNAAGLMLLIGAEFIAMLLVIVYVGAVAVLFLFVVMMLDIDFAELRSGLARYGVFGFLIAGVLAGEIIIAGSGMSNGGRVIHHEKRYLSDPKNALLLVGYQAAGSLGRQLEDGATAVTILGEEVSVRARVETISGYSAHKDSDNLLEFVRHDADAAERVFVVMGEPKASMFLAQKIRDYLAVDARVPEQGDAVELEF